MQTQYTHRVVRNMINYKVFFRNDFTLLHPICVQLKVKYKLKLADYMDTKTDDS